MEYFLKKYRHLKSKILDKFHRLLILDKIYNLYNKAPQKCLEFFWQVWIGEIGKKDYKNAKRIKKNK